MNGYRNTLISGFNHPYPSPPTRAQLSKQDRRKNQDISLSIISSGKKNKISSKNAKKYIFARPQVLFQAQQWPLKDILVA
jgi:hypothetical protein